MGSKYSTSSQLTFVVVPELIAPPVVVVVVVPFELAAVVPSPPFVCPPASAAVSLVTDSFAVPFSSPSTTIFMPSSSSTTPPCCCCCCCCCSTSSFACRIICPLSVQLELLLAPVCHRHRQLTLVARLAAGRGERNRHRYLQPVLGCDVRTLRVQFALLRLLDHDVTVRVQERRIDQLLLPVRTLHQDHLVVAVAADHLQRFALTEPLATLHHHADALQQLLDLLRVRALHQDLVALGVRREDVIVQLQHLAVVQDQIDLLTGTGCGGPLRTLHVLQLHRHVFRVRVLAVLRLLAIVVQARHADRHALQLLLLFLRLLLISLIEGGHIDTDGLLLVFLEFANYFSHLLLLLLLLLLVRERAILRLRGKRNVERNIGLRTVRMRAVRRCCRRCRVGSTTGPFRTLRIGVHTLEDALEVAECEGAGVAGVELDELRVDRITDRFPQRFVDRFLQQLLGGGRIGRRCRCRRDRRLLLYLLLLLLVLLLLLLVLLLLCHGGLQLLGALLSRLVHLQVAHQLFTLAERNVADATLEVVRLVLFRVDRRLFAGFEPHQAHATLERFELDVLAEVIVHGGGGGCGAAGVGVGRHPGVTSCRRHHMLRLVSLLLLHHHPTGRCDDRFLRMFLCAVLPEEGDAREYQLAQLAPPAVMPAVLVGVATVPDDVTPAVAFCAAAAAAAAAFRGGQFS
uniref:Uncharacterized protein n=1 Tax=Anopheles farauti TaxID=69004 RepID=A0A182QPL1_9DIPT